MTNKIGIILGSGLNKFSDELVSPKIVSEDASTFHKLKVLRGVINDTEIVMFSGRRHFYEGYSYNTLFENIDIAKELGVNFLIITNAAGGINTNFKVSDLMLITSHFSFVNTFIPFKSYVPIYNHKDLNKIRELATTEKIELKSGSYCCSTGPMYETKSEIRFLSKMGIDAVGMSTVPEILYANSIGIKTIAISCITNLLNENSNAITHHDEVVEAGNKAYDKFSKLLKKIISHSPELVN